MARALRFKQINVARQSGEMARIRVIKGPDLGTTYVVTSTRVIVGRGEDADVVLTDLKSSRHHVEIVLNGSQWVLRDLGSVNGVLCNGISARKTELTGKDVLTIGETTFEFLSSMQSSTRSLVIPFPTTVPSPGQRGDKGTGFTATGTLGALGTQAATPKPESSGKLLIGIVLGVLLLIFMTTEEKKDQSASKVKAAAKKADKAELESLYTQISNPTAPPNTPEAREAVKTADQFFRAGFREYREGNFLRAKTQFENALQIYPGHALSILYLQNCKLRTDDLVATYRDTGKKNLESGRIKSAKGQFESILRILSRDQTNQAYIEAKEQLERIKRELASDVQVQNGDIKQ